MTRRSKNSPVCGVPPRILLIGAALFAISPRAADAGLLESMGLDTPFLLGQAERFTPIDIGGDGVTDLVCAGAAILEGAQVLEGSSSETGEVVHLLRRDPAAGWRRAQSFHIEGTILEIAAGTIDGDERDDILILARGSDDLFVIPFLQSEDGTLVRGPRTDIGGRVDSPSQLSVGFGGIAVLTGWTDREDGAEFWILSLRYDERAGFRPLHESVFHLDDLELGASHLILYEGPNPMVVLRGAYEGGSGYRLWTVTQDSTGWRNPSPAIAIDHDPGSLEVVRRDHRSEAWGIDCGSDPYQPRLTLRQLAAAPGADSLVSRDYLFPDPHDLRSCSAGRFFMDLGDSLLFALAQYSDGAYQRRLGSVGPQGVSQIGETWVTWQTELRTLLRAPAGGIDLLFSNGAAHCILPSRTLPSSHLDLYLDQVEEIETRGDFDHDGLDDLVFEGRCGDRAWSYWMLRGRGEPPWFRDPEPIARAERLEVAATADLDGDGFLDLVMRATGPPQPHLVPYFWTGWRFERDEGAVVPAPHSAMMLSDFDGNGRTEVIQFEFPMVRICQWGADRNPQEAVEIQGSLFAFLRAFTIGDFDGDGRSEILRLMPTLVELWKTNLATGAFEFGFSSPSRIEPWTLFPLDLDGDGADELFWTDRGSYGIHSIVPGENRFSQRASGPFPGDWTSTPSAADFDLDGRADLLLTDAFGACWLLLDPLGQARVETALPPEARGDNRTRAVGYAWQDVDHDGDLDQVVLCAEGIVIRRNPTIVPGSRRAQGVEWLRLISENPARGRVRLAVRAGDASAEEDRIAIGLYDISGRSLWRDKRRGRAGEWLEIEIDPRAIAPPLSAGVYFLKIQRRADAVSRPILLVH